MLRYMLGADIFTGCFFIFFDAFDFVFVLFI